MTRFGNGGRSAIGLGMLALAGVAIGVLLSLRGSMRTPRGIDRDTGGHIPDDLALDRPRAGPDDRAPDAFRPDPTAPIAKAERDAFRPATMKPQGLEGTLS